MVSRAERKQAEDCTTPDGLCWLKGLGLYPSSVTNSLNPSSLQASVFLSVKWVSDNPLGSIQSVTALNDEALNQKNPFLMAGPPILKAMASYPERPDR